MEVEEILQRGDPRELRALFGFDKTNTLDEVIFKFNIWARYFFIDYFESDDAKFHNDIDYYNCQIYFGLIDTFTDAAFRGAAKTSRTKLFLAFTILNDRDHFRKYIKVLASDGDNSKQIVTDVYNMFVNGRVHKLYPDTFADSAYKREERMASFTTSFGVKLLADTVGTEARGALQEYSRPDLILFEDFETRKTLRSAKTTKAIWDNMEEARLSLAKGGGAIYNCNYLSEMGNVDKLVKKETERNVVLIIPIMDKEGNSTWPARFSQRDIENMKVTDDDFEGERMCQPSASKDIMFDRERIDAMDPRLPIKVTGGFRIYKNYNPSHRYASGHDVGGGVGLDSSTSVLIDFDVIPCQVVGVYSNNMINPGDFGDEVKREAEFFGGCLVAPERNNHGHTTIFRLKQLGANVWYQQKDNTKIDSTNPTELGWLTNDATKPMMIMALKKAIEEGLIELNDKELIADCRSFTRNDLMDKVADPRLVTKHFDLVIALAIAWQMRSYAQVTTTKVKTYTQPAYQPLYKDIGV